MGWLLLKNGMFNREVLWKAESVGFKPKNQLKKAFTLCKLPGKNDFVNFSFYIVIKNTIV